MYSNQISLSDTMPLHYSPQEITRGQALAVIAIHRESLMHQADSASKREISNS